MGVTFPPARALPKIFPESLGFLLVKHNWFSTTSTSIYFSQAHVPSVKVFLSVFPREVPTRHKGGVSLQNAAAFCLHEEDVINQSTSWVEECVMAC